MSAASRAAKAMDVSVTMLVPPIFVGDHLFAARLGDEIILGTLPPEWARSSQRRKAAGLRQPWRRDSTTSRLTATLTIDSPRVTPADGPAYFLCHDRPAFVAPSVFPILEEHGLDPETDEAMRNWYGYAWSIPQLNALLSEGAAMLTALALRGETNSARVRGVEQELTATRERLQATKRASATLMSVVRERLSSDVGLTPTGGGRA